MKVILLTAIEYVREEEEEVAKEEHFSNKRASENENEVQGEPKIHVAVLEAVEAWNEENRNNDMHLQSGQWFCILRALG